MLSSPVLGVLMVALFVWVGVYLYLRRDHPQQQKRTHSDDELFF